MIHITKEELLKLARISNVRLYDDEIPGLTKQLQDVLSYAQRVQEVVTTAHILSEQKNENIVRMDTVIKTDPESLLALAPQQEEHFLVVPKIIDSK